MGGVPKNVDNSYLNPSVNNVGKCLRRKVISSTKWWFSEKIEVGEMVGEALGENFVNLKKKVEENVQQKEDLQA